MPGFPVCVMTFKVKVCDSLVQSSTRLCVATPFPPLLRTVCMLYDVCKSWHLKKVLSIVSNLILAIFVTGCYTRNGQLLVLGTCFYEHSLCTNEDRLFPSSDKWTYCKLLWMKRLLNALNVNVNVT